MANAALPAGSRKTSTAWHPSWRLRAKVAEPGRVTTSVYNGQSDPFAGGALASCAPTSATLPDGQRIAVLCRLVEQATTDADGSLGLAAPLQAGVPAREQRWTYNPYGQVLTHDGPRTDIADTTQYTYYTDTVFTGTDPNAVGHTVGDLWTLTNAAGKVTTYTKYDKNGNVLELTDPNSVVTSYTYDARQRLLTTTVGGQTTTNEYWPTGLLKKVTQPDNVTYVQYTYDDAHRLTGVSDNLNNSISYTLDNMGNRTAEAVKDPSGTLKRTLGRSIDALGRVQQVTGRE
jgi:YD repeat-containing protein